MHENNLQSEFLDHLYAAAVGADDWKNVLATYTKLVGGHAGLMNFYDLATGRNRTVEWHNYDDKHIAASDTYWQMHEPWSAAGLQQVARTPEMLMTGFVSRGSSLVPQRELLASEWYNEFGADNLVQDCLGTVGVTGGRMGSH